MRFFSLFFGPKRNHKPLKLIMTLLVKNEENILEENLVFHKSMGVDGFVVTDNSSTDRTREILDKYKRKGWILEIIDEPGQDHSQVLWVNRMITTAKDIYKADWVINCDADEFWYAKSGNLKTSIYATRANVLKCFWRNMVPTPGNTKFWQNILAVEKPPEAGHNYDLSKWNLYDFTYPKVMHSVDGFKSISFGNHSVEMVKKKKKKIKDVVIYHFSVQNYEKFESKVVAGGEALGRNKNLDKRDVVHWRYWYECYKNGCLKEEYEKIIGANYIDEFLDKQVLVYDKNIYNYFLNIEGKNIK